MRRVPAAAETSVEIAAAKAAERERNLRPRRRSYLGTGAFNKRDLSSSFNWLLLIHAVALIGSR